MTLIDGLLLLLLVPFALQGFRRGLLREGFALAGLVGGWLAAGAFGPEVATALAANAYVPKTAALPVAYVLVFVGVVLAARVAGFLVSRLARVVFLGPLDRGAGIAFGTLKGAALIGFALLLLERLVPSPAVTELVATSRLAAPLVAVAKAMLELGRDVLEEAPAGA